MKTKKGLLNLETCTLTQAGASRQTRTDGGYNVGKARPYQVASRAVSP